MSDTLSQPGIKPWIAAIAPYVPGRATGAGGRALIKLSSNENPLGSSPDALAAFAAAGQALDRYPDPGATALRTAIAAQHGVDDDRIVCGTGSDEILHMAAIAFAGPGDEVLYVRYGFAVYDIAARRVGATPVIAPDRDYGTDVDALLACVTANTRLVYVANPNNPTGTLVGREEIARLHAGLPAETVLVLDQAYAEYLMPDQDDGGLALAETSRNVLVARTFSKIYGLAAARVGWAYGHPDLIAALNRVRGTFNVTSAAQAAAAAAVADQAFVDRTRAHNRIWRDWFTHELTTLGNHGVTAVPSAGNFVLVLFNGAVTAEQAAAGLEQRGYITRWRAAPGLDHALRITIGSEEQMRGMMAALREIIGAPTAA